MANPIVPGQGYWELFSNGQGLIPVADYFDYTPDLDANFTLLRETVNTVIAEVKAIAGPNALFGQDVLFLDDPTIAPTTTTGRIGRNTVRFTINGGNPALVDISPGAMSLIGLRTDVPFQQKGYVGASATIFLGMDVNGVASWSASAGAQLFDVATGVWDGAQFTSVTDLLETFLDGDEVYQQRTEPADTPFNPTSSPIQLRSPSERLDNFSRAFGGYSTLSNGDPLGPFLIAGGTAGAPRIGLATGADPPVVDANAGLYRSAASQLSFSTASTERVRLGVAGLQVLNGSAGTPSLSFFGDPDTGVYRHAVNELGLVCNGANALLVRETQARAGVAGSAGTPYWSCDVANRDTTGIYFPADDELGISTNGTEAVRIGSAQVVTFPLQPAGSATRAALQNIANNTATAVLLTAEDFDITAQHDTVTNPDRVTIGTGEGGRYTVSAQVTFDESTGNGGVGGVAGLRLVEITVNGTTRGRTLIHGDGTNDEGPSCSTVVNLVATDIIRVVATQVTGGTMDITNSRLSWAKVS